MSRQHTAPVYLSPDGETAVSTVPLSLGREGGVSEATIQTLIHDHPGLLPIDEIDAVFSGPVPICMELQTPAGAIDNFMVTASGLPVLVECKLWRNPESRREVVGQILDYAKELSRWSVSDLQREVSRRRGASGGGLFETVAAVHPGLDEIAFNDALTANLRRGRFLLLIVGDGIREGVEAIAEYIQTHAAMHFSLGLVELPIFAMPDGGRLVAPRVLARTNIVTRTVIALPEGMALQEDQVRDERSLPDSERTQALGDERQAFWAEFLPYVHLDDPEQLLPRPTRRGFIEFVMPAPGGHCWLTVYRDMAAHSVGIFVSSTRNTAGEFAMAALVDAWPEFAEELGGDAGIITRRDERPTIAEARQFQDLSDGEIRRAAFAWLADRVNAFVNVVRPRVRSAVADYEVRG